MLRSWFLRFFAQLATAVLLLTALGCERDSRTPAIGEAYAAPAKLPLRQEISLRSAVVATVNHGERLDILAQRRRFTRVRTAKGIEGWVDERNLMDKTELDALQNRSQSLRGYPSQGQATVYESVNVHTQPQRTSPSYLQIVPGEKVDVIGHEWTARVDPPRKVLVKPQPRTPRAERKQAKQTRVPLPPKPSPPPPPADWLEISKQRSGPKPPPPPPTPTPAEELPRDEWSLIRNAAGQSGWVITRRLSMAIPDEVAQYAEGRRITSYFSLGTVTDGDKTKQNWVWTTIASGEHDYDFDGYRVFIWSLRHHRYETAYIQRRVEGYAPVLRNTIDGRPGFSVCLETPTQRIRRQYVLVENMIKAAGETPCAPGAAPPPGSESGSSQPLQPVTAKGLTGKLREHLGLLRRRLFGK